MSETPNDRVEQLGDSYWLNGRIDRAFFVGLAREAYELGQASCAPWMQHTFTCPKTDDERSPYEGEDGECTCGLDEVLTALRTRAGGER